ncbi:MAG: hypothetical protein H5U40_02065 [Polyangiaceae bacterium]|nr:hypothetical protein [Polyangiaceae bacterium]
MIFILATDGLPATSKEPGEHTDSATGRANRQVALDAVKTARLAGIPTYVISVASDVHLHRHLEQVACQGGTGPTPSALPYNNALEPRCDSPAPGNGPGAIPANNSAELRSALVDDIIGPSIPCEFQLAGRVSDLAAARAQGRVSVGGVSVSLDPANGWYLADDGRTFTLNGTACESFRLNPGSQLEATFPCGSGVVIIPL